MASALSLTLSQLQVLATPELRLPAAWALGTEPNMVLQLLRNKLWGRV